MSARARFVYGWDHPETAARYHAFASRDGRYARANRALAERVAASLGGARRSVRILDFAAGTGETARALLGAIPRADVECVEPAAAMRSLGARALPSARFRADLPEDRFDVIACGAAIWQLDDPGAAVAALAARLLRGGVLAFTIPSLYLGVPDAAGEGPDPAHHRFYEQLSLLARGSAVDVPPAEGAETRLLDEAAWRSLLESHDLDVTVTPFEHALSTRELRDWLAIPVLTDRLLGHLPLVERDRALDEALRAAGDSSFRREGWRLFEAQTRR